MRSTASAPQAAACCWPRCALGQGFPWLQLRNDCLALNAMQAASVNRLSPLQAALPCLLSVPEGAQSELTLRGGTDAAFAPPVWYTQHVTLPLLRAWWGLDAHIQVTQAPWDVGQPGVRLCRRAGWHGRSKACAACAAARSMLQRPLCCLLRWPARGDEHLLAGPACGRLRPGCACS